jgi:hypothetical protein
MIRAGLSYLLAVAIFAHAALGCCWHTACAECLCTHSTRVESEHNCKHHHNQGPHSPKPCKCRLDCECAGKIVLSKKTELGKPGLSGLCPPAAVLAASIPELICVERRAFSTGIDGLAPPLRAHLRLRVLLI